MRLRVKPTTAQVRALAKAIQGGVDNFTHYVPITPEEMERRVEARQAEDRVAVARWHADQATF